jgi:hypothetical protein
MKKTLKSRIMRAIRSIYLRAQQAAHDAADQFDDLPPHAQSDAPTYQYREIGDVDGWQNCSKATYDRMASRTNIVRRMVPAAVRR